MTQNSLYFFQLEMQSQVVGDETRIVKNSFMILVVYFERCDVISGKITQTPFSHIMAQIFCSTRRLVEDFLLDV